MSFSQANSRGRLLRFLSDNLDEFENNLSVTGSLSITGRLVAPSGSSPADDAIVPPIDTYYANSDWLDVNAYGEDAPAFYQYWQNWDGTALYHNAGYYMDACGRVHLRGLVETTSTSAGTSIFVLPVAYRPKRYVIACTFCRDSAARITIKGSNADPDPGLVYVGTGFADGNNQWISLEGISFDTREP